MKFALVAFAQCITVLSCLAVQAAPEPFVAAVQELLQDPALYLSSTVPNEPLLTGNNTLVALNPSTETTIEAMERLIAASRQEILLQVYEYDDQDEAADRVYQALRRRVERAVAEKQPLAVGIVVSRAWPSENNLTKNNIIGLIELLSQQQAQAPHITFALYRYWGSLLSILHTKSLVIDGHIALHMTGNLLTHGGIANDSVNMSAQLQGPVVTTLRADWAQAQSLSVCSAVAGSGASGLGRNDLPLASHPRSINSDAPVHAAVFSRTSRWAPWPDTSPNLHNEGLAALLRAANSTIQIVNPSMGAAGIQDAVIDAIVHRNVRVTAIVSKWMNATREHYLFGGTNAEQAYKIYRRLLALGGPQAASRFHILWGSVDGITPGETHSPGNIHAKVAAIDDDCLLIGSTNFNWLSLNTSREVTVALMAQSITHEFKEKIWAPLLAQAVALKAEDMPPCQGANHQDIVCTLVKTLTHP